jgi:hypothetical protein
MLEGGEEVEQSPALEVGIAAEAGRRWGRWFRWQPFRGR